MSNRYTIKLGGESGQGINTLGILLCKSLKSVGYSTFAYREYPSLIKGGVASYQIDISSKDINSSSKFCNILAILDPDSLPEYLPSLVSNGVLIYDDKIDFTQEQLDILQKQNISTIYIDTQMIAREAGGNPIM
jgi:2-oxoglutarate ferredoxin oxidoreductase subunit alpha